MSSFFWVRTRIPASSLAASTRSSCATRRGTRASCTGDDCGGIYPRAEEKPKYHHIDKGVAAAGERGEAGRRVADADGDVPGAALQRQGEKIENARLVKATLNGQVIHENAEFKTPTGANYVKKEVAAGPFLLQADHGPTAFRNVRIRER